MIHNCSCRQTKIWVPQLLVRAFWWQLIAPVRRDMKLQCLDKFWKCTSYDSRTVLGFLLDQHQLPILLNTPAAQTSLLPVRNPLQNNSRATLFCTRKPVSVGKVKGWQYTGWRKKNACPLAPTLTRFICLRFLSLGFYLKSIVYVRKPRTVDDLKVSIREEIATVPQEMLVNVMQNFEESLRTCVRQEGRHLSDIIFP